GEWLGKNSSVGFFGPGREGTGQGEEGTPAIWSELLPLSPARPAGCRADLTQGVCLPRTPDAAPGRSFSPSSREKGRKKPRGNPFSPTPPSASGALLKPGNEPLSFALRPLAGHGVCHSGGRGVPSALAGTRRKT